MASLISSRIRTVKELICNQVFELLYEPSDIRYNKGIDKLVERNNHLKSINCASFSFRGVKYTHSDYPMAEYGAPRLHRELEQEMDDLESEWDTVFNQEKPFVMAYFTKAMNRSNSIQDYFLLFPEFLHEALNKFATQEWKESWQWFPREMTDEEIAQFITEHEPWLAKLRHRMMLNLVQN